jgi:hypothetical protein
LRLRDVGSGATTFNRDAGNEVYATADNSSGLATITQSVIQGGVYIVKVINLSVGPVDVWTAATQQVSQCCCS